MKMLKYCLLASLLFSWISACGKGKAVMNFEIIVTDDDGNPVENCSVCSSVIASGNQNAKVHRDGVKKVEVLTDKKGRAAFEMVGLLPDVQYKAFPDEGTYYPDLGGRYSFNTRELGHKPEARKRLNIVIKKRRKPIAMYAKRGPRKVPGKEIAYGYDLLVGDWVQPYGRGKTKDMLFYAESKERGPLDFSRKLTVSFPGKGNGFLLFVSPPHKGSFLKSGYLAPEDGYSSRLANKITMEKGTVDSSIVENANYYIRVRTTYDSKGNIVSAHYGKIYGDFMKFTHYLNPTPNDRNVEFDPKKNLIDTGRRGFKVQQP